MDESADVELTLANAECDLAGISTKLLIALDQQRDYVPKHSVELWEKERMVGQCLIFKSGPQERRVSPPFTGLSEGQRRMIRDCCADLAGFRIKEDQFSGLGLFATRPIAAENSIGFWGILRAVPVNQRERMNDRSVVLAKFSMPPSSTGVREQWMLVLQGALMCPGSYVNGIGPNRRPNCELRVGTNASWQKVFEKAQRTGNLKGVWAKAGEVNVVLVKNVRENDELILNYDWQSLPQQKNGFPISWDLSWDQSRCNSQRFY